ncbi:acylphosphatase [Corynebacterium alimapuense]|uniref:acylphosphatase n=1 Tax=Corynebacterium alimapuense TaxID=1576874 RepID=A0A3M8K8H8_9CORY|nr:acylphosphatase [Corynebacterium alimapuense]RNE49436.1 acylphosphatase [Corynebacterium alimapuense]
MNEKPTRLTAFVHGNVQGVGFRWWTRSQAMELGLSGSANNLIDGRVCVVVEGPSGQVAELLERLEQQPSSYRRPGRVETVVVLWATPKGVVGFTTR